MTIRDEIAEIVLEIRNESARITKQGGGVITSLNSFADKILAIPIMKKCDECGGKLLIYWDTLATDKNRRYMAIFNYFENGLWLFYWHEANQNWVTLEKATDNILYSIQHTPTMELVDLQKFPYFLKAIPTGCNCPTCKGKKEVPIMHEMECPNCDDGVQDTSGFGDFNTCEECKGSSKIKRPKTLKDLIEEGG